MGITVTRAPLSGAALAHSMGMAHPSDLGLLAWTADPRWKGKGRGDERRVRGRGDGMTAIDSRTVVETAGTPVKLVPDTVVASPGGRLVVTCETDNTGVIMFGFTDQVRAGPTPADRKGFGAASAGDTVSYDIEAGPAIGYWIDAQVSGDGVTWSYTDG